jgi:hypothetical protein
MIRKAYQTAGLGPDDIDLAEAHDATVFGELSQTESRFRQAWPGRASPPAAPTPGPSPINTSGGPSPAATHRGHRPGADHGDRLAAPWQWRPPGRWGSIGLTQNAGGSRPAARPLSRFTSSLAPSEAQEGQPWSSNRSLERGARSRSSNPGDR